jgi:hypothetical protein
MYIQSTKRWTLDRHKLLIIKDSSIVTKTRINLEEKRVFLEKSFQFYFNRGEADETIMTDLEEIKNSFESKCSIKIETNSRGHNTSIHVYQGVTEREIDDTIFKAIYGISFIKYFVVVNRSLLLS